MKLNLASSILHIFKSVNIFRSPFKGMVNFILKLNVFERNIVFCSILTVFLIGSLKVSAEGSKNLFPAGATGYRAFLTSANNASVNYCGIINTGKMYAYAKAGEVIYIGSSAMNRSGSIRVTNPIGNVQTYSGSSTGQIANRSQELAGPSALASGGYNAISRSVTATTEGIWTIEFLSSNMDADLNNADNATHNLVGNDNWGSSDQSRDTPMILAWDITVASGTSVKNGRVFMNVFTASLGRTGQQFNGNLYVLTNDGFQYKYSGNGLAPWVYAFFANNKGLKVYNTNQPIYKSASNEDVVNYPDHTNPSFEFHDPTTLDTDNDVTHLLFYNTPNNDMPADANYYNGGVLNRWLYNVVPPTISISNLDIVGMEGASFLGTGGLAGGYIKFNSNVNSNYEIKIDADNNGSYTNAVDVTLTGGAISGLNSVYWDGKNANGVLIANNNTIKVKVSLLYGEVHFPISDAENNNNGIILQRTAPLPTDYIVYWDDSTVGGTTSLTGTNSSAGAHAWTNNFGDVKFIDSWTYQIGATAELTKTIVRKETNLETVSLTQSNASLCAGSNITYTTVVKNNGPDNASGAKFIFTVPARVTINSVTRVITGTGNSTSTSTPGSTYIANVDLNNGSTITYTINATVTGTTGGSVTAQSAMLRATNVSDPDATNPDNGIPSDPNNECDALPSGVGCNNIKTIATTVYAIPVSTLTITGSTVSQGNNGTITINSAQSGVTYKAYIGAVLVASGVGTGANLVLTINASNLSIGNNSITVTADNGGFCITNMTNLPIVCVGPIAENDINQALINTPVAGQLMTNDEGVNSISSANIGGTNIPLATATTVSGVDDSGTAVTNAGSIIINSNGTYTFTPATGFTGTINPITYVGLGTGGATDNAILSIEVMPKVVPGNNPPVAQNDVTSTEINIAVSSSVLTNDSDPDGNTLTVASALYPGGGITIGTATVVSGINASGTAVTNAGSLLLNSNGTYTFTPTTGFIGKINDITYTLSDGNGGTDTAILNINVLPNNGNSTFANDDANAKPQGTTMTGNILTNDTDPEGNTQTVTAVSANGTNVPVGTATAIPSVGTLTVNLDGSYNFVPLASFTGTAPFIYTKCDNGSPQICDQATLYLTCLPRTIIAENDINQVPMNTTVSGQLMTNDEGVTSISSANIGVTNIPLATATTVSGIDDSGTAVANAGTITINSNGTYTFTPALGFIGTINPITYVGTGANGATDNAILSIEVLPKVNPGNNPPVAQNDVASTDVNIAVSSSVMPNDSDPDGNTLTVTDASIAGGSTITIGTASTVRGMNSAGSEVINAGTITLNSNGTYTFTPATGFTGTINDITYTISDGNGGTDTAILKINVLPNNGNTTFANDDANSGIQGLNMTGNILTNDTDPEGNTQTVTSASYNGTNVTIGIENGFSGIGSLTINANGTYTFIPLTNFLGTIPVIYTKCDNGTPQACDEATLYLTSLTRAIFAENDINQTPMNTNVSGQLMTNDEGVTSVISATIGGINIPLATATTVSGINDAGNAVSNAGTITINSDGTYTFIPAFGFVGTINPIIYIGASPQLAPRVFGATDDAILSIEVIPNIYIGNNPPVAQNDVASTESGIAVSSSVIPNDSDPDGNTLTVTSATYPGGGITIGTSTIVSGINTGGAAVTNAGSIVLNSNGTFTFTPATGFSGSVNDITYTISDGNGGTDTAILNINVLPNNGNTTFANDDANAKPRGTTMTGNILTNDTDPEGNTQTVTTVTANGTNVPVGTATAIPSVGTLTITSTGAYTFVPLAAFTGTVLVPYTKCDNGTPQTCDQATLYLTCLPNTIIAENDINQTPLNTATTGQLMTNDEGVTSISSATIGGTNIPLATATTVSGINDAGTTVTNAGSITINSNGTYTFTPATGFTGTINPITYVGAGLGSSTDNAILSIEVLPKKTGGNNPPVAQNDVNSTEVNVSITGSTVLNNDSDPDGNTLTITAASIGGSAFTFGTAKVVAGVNLGGVAVTNAGSLTLNSNGTYTFVPTSGFTGTINDVSYTISDGNGASDSAVLSINVLPNNGNTTFANDDANVKAQGITMTGNVLTNDFDPEGHTQSVSSATVNGTGITIGSAYTISGVGAITLNSNGTYTFVPLASFIGTQRVIYNKCDVGSPVACDEATLYLTCIPSTRSCLVSNKNVTPIIK